MTKTINGLTFQVSSPSFYSLLNLDRGTLDLSFLGDAWFICIDEKSFHKFTSREAAIGFIERAVR